MTRWLAAAAVVWGASLATAAGFQADESAGGGLQASEAGFIGPGGLSSGAPAKAAAAPAAPSTTLDAGPAAWSIGAPAPRAGVGGGTAPRAAAKAPDPPDIRWDPGPALVAPGEGCVVKPAAISKIGLVIHNRPAPGKLILDSTPKVCDRAFCAAVGFGGRACCPLGSEGSPERIACELSMMGVDPTDLTAGPHWMLHGQGEIRRHPSNPFLAIVKLPEGSPGGWATACTHVRPVVCATIRVP
ncbi:MAG: hypothetical protein HY553_02410 [Elusimicrobia bacterium]|nr:hypothetical protein [Elusimicrobiota bacterium]